MLSKSLLIAFVFCVITLDPASCEAALNTEKFSKIRQGFRINEESVYSKISQISLVACSSLCSSDAECSMFQFEKFSNSTRAKGSCEFLNVGSNFDELDNDVITDSSCNIYHCATENSKPTSVVVSSTTTSTYPTTTVTSPTTTVTIPTTTVATPMTKSSTCSYAGTVAKSICGCSEDDPQYCEGLLHCRVNYAKPVLLLLDFSVDSSYANAVSYCKKLDMKLLMIKTQQEQATVCGILYDYAGPQAKYEYWMGLKKAEEGDAPYKYGDGTELGSYSAWMDDPPPSFGCVLLASVNSGFKWKVDTDGACDGATPSGWKRLTICTLPLQ